MPSSPKATTTSALIDPKLLTEEQEEVLQKIMEGFDREIEKQYAKNKELLAEFKPQVKNAARAALLADINQAAKISPENLYQMGALTATELNLLIKTNQELKEKKIRKQVEEVFRKGFQR